MKKQQYYAQYGNRREDGTLLPQKTGKKALSRRALSGAGNSGSTGRTLLFLGGAIVLASAGAYLFQTGYEAKKLIDTYEIAYKDFDLKPTEQGLEFDINALLGNQTNAEISIEQPRVHLFVNGKKIGVSQIRTGADKSVTITPNSQSDLGHFRIVVPWLSIVPIVPGIMFSANSAVKSYKAAKKDYDKKSKVLELKISQNTGAVSAKWAKELESEKAAFWQKVSEILNKKLGLSLGYSTSLRFKGIEYQGSLSTIF